MHRYFHISLLILIVRACASAQISSFPYSEHFDRVAAPSLPSGWTTTTNRNSSGDFTTSTASVRSSPNCVSATNGKISQSLISPVFNFSGRFADSIFFYERRTSTLLSGLLVEASVDGDTTFSIPISDTLKLVNSTSYVKRSLPLPGIVSGKSNIRFRWRVLADSLSGSTGVIRFDDLSVTVKKAADLAVTSLIVLPKIVQKGNTIFVSAGITNKALAGIFSFTVQLTDSSALVSSINDSSFIAANDSLTIQLKYPNIRAGRHSLAVRVLLDGDEDTTNNSASAVVSAGYFPRDALINEIMYAPPDGKEWIELVNNSPDTLDLCNWKISDRSTATIITFQKHLFPPQEFVLLAKDTSFKDAYPGFSGSIIRVSSLPSFNNDSDAVVIFDQTGRTIDSLTYHSFWCGTNGTSLERIDTAGLSAAHNNWKASLNPFGATPGKTNSVTKKNFDAAVSSVSFLPSLPVVGQNVTAVAAVNNIGVKDMTNIAVQFFIDENTNGQFEFPELKESKNIPSLLPDDSAVVSAAFSLLPQGNHSVGVILFSGADLEASNDTLRAVLSIGLEPKSIIVNEMMYAPTGDMPEWIECYNASPHTVDLKGWKMSDATPSKSILSALSKLIPSHSYCIIARDSAFVNYFSVTVPVIISPFPTLNNSSSDAVVLYDERGGVMDSVLYKPSWGGANGNSLQRFDYAGSSADSANWKSVSPDPGMENSIARKEFDVEIRNTAAVKNSSGILISAAIVNAGRSSAGSFSVKIFHDANNDSIPQPDELISSNDIAPIAPLDSAVISSSWNASLSGRQAIIILAECPQDQRAENNSAFVSVNNSFALHALIVNEIMYEPAPDGAEFVELFNPTNDSINIVGWKLMDTPSSSGSRGIIALSPVDRYVPPQGYYLAASDSSVCSQFPLLAGEMICINPSLSLSNSGEDIVLVDLTEAPIDSLRYFPSWHLNNITASGRSLEKISPAGSGSDFRNWSSSVAPTGATPLEKNSIYTSGIPLTKSLSLSPNPFSPDNDGFEDFLSINYSLPAQSARLRIRIYDVAGRLIRRLATEELTPSQGSIIWNGLDDNGHKTRIGMYIILLEALDNFGGVIHAMKDVAVVAKKL
jgi:hypothetical protein